MGRDCNQKGRRNLSRGDDHFFRRFPDMVPRGENHKGAKLSKSQVLEIRELIKNGASQHAVSRKLNISRTHIRRILRGESRQVEI